MGSKPEQSAGGLSATLETVCGWAVCAVVAYALLFVNLTGDGSLCNALIGSIQDAIPVPVEDVPTRSYVLAAKPVDADTQAQDRMLMVPEAATEAMVVTVQDPSQRSEAALVDAPADPPPAALAAPASAPAKDWRVHIQGQLPTLSVYGQGDERSAASVGTARGAALPASLAGATASVAGSAYRAALADPDATPRPGVSDRVAPLRAQGGDDVSNFLGSR